MAELADTFDLKLVPLGEYANLMRRRFGFAYRAATIPAGTYSNVADTSTLAVPNYVVCRADAAPDVVHDVTAVLFERKESIARRVDAARFLDTRSAIFIDPLTLHPGALQYYRDVKP